MKNYIKTVSVMACITIVCVAVLAVVNKFWYVEPPDLSTQMIAEVVDKNAQFEKVDVELTPDVLGVYQVTNGEFKGMYVIHSWGKYANATRVETYVSIALDGKSIHKVAISRLECTPSWAFGADNVSYLNGKDPTQVKAADFHSGASETGLGIMNAVISAFEFYGVTFEGVVLDPPEIKRAKTFFGNDVESVIELTALKDTEKKIDVFEVTMADGAKHRIYYAYGQDVSYTGKGDTNEQIAIYVGVNLNTQCWSGIEFELINNTHAPKSTVTDYFAPSSNRPFGKVNRVDDFHVVGTGATGSASAVRILINRIVDNVESLPSGN